MSTITVRDGTTIFYKDWGSGPVVTFSHGWPLCSDAWDVQMLFLAQNGFRVVAHDRRGHGRSSQAWSGNDMNGYAPTDLVRRCPRVRWISSGSGACRPASRTRTTASRPFLKPTSLKTSK